MMCVELFNSHPMCAELMAPCLMGLYGDVEHTGFYEKLQHRYAMLLCVCVDMYVFFQYELAY